MSGASAARISVFLTPLLLVIGVIVIVVLFLDRRSEPLSPSSPHYDEAASLDLSAGQAGVLAHESGASIEVPNGAVTESVAVSIREVPLPPSPLEVGRVFDFSLANGRFTEPVTIRIPFELDHGVDASEVVPLRWEADRNAWSELSGEVDASTQTVAVTTPEVGMFSTVARRTLDSARRESSGLRKRSPAFRGGSMLRRYGSGASTLATIYDGVMYFGGCASDDGDIGVYARDADTSRLLWRQSWGSQVHDCATSTPVVSNGTVYIVSSCEDCEVAWDGDVHTTGDVSALDASTGELLWRYERGAWDESSWPVVSDGRVYLLSSGDRVTALDGVTGTVLWQYKVKGILGRILSGIWVREPIVSGGVVYILESSGLYALDAITGRLLWRHKSGGSSIVVSRGVLYIGAERDYTYALDAGTGDLLWRSETGVLRRPLTDSLRGSSPVVSGGVVYTGSVGGDVSALAASTGELLWRHDAGRSVMSSPVVSGGIVYLKSWGDEADANYMTALDSYTGDLLWKYVVGRPQSSRPFVVSGGLVYADSGGDSRGSSVFALDGVTGVLHWRYDHARLLGVSGESVYITSSWDGIVALAAGSPLLWRYEGVGFGPSPPAVFGGAAYVKIGNVVHALDADTGEAFWRFKMDSHAVVPVSASGGVVYVGARDGWVYALDAGTGDLLWRYETGALHESFLPTVSGGVVYIGARDGWVYALDEGTGDLLWQYETGDTVSSAPVVSGEVVYIGSWDEHVYALDASTGSLRWRYDTRGKVSHSPVVSGGRVFVASGDGLLHALDADTGSPLWRNNKLSGEIYWITDSGSVVYATADDSVYAFLPKGDLLWKYNAGRIVPVSPVVSGGVVYVVTAGHVLGLDGDTGTLLWQYQTGRVLVSPVVSGGVVYVATANGHVLGLDGDTGDLHWRYDTGVAIPPSHMVLASGSVLYLVSRNHVFALDVSGDE